MSARSRATERGPGTAGWRARDSVALLFAVLAGTAAVVTTACKDDGPTQPEVVGTLIGPEGGTVTVEDVTLAIPAGALEEATDIVIENVGDAAFTSDPFYIDGTTHLIKPEGLALDGGATLTIRYEPGNVPPGYFPQRLQLTEHDRQSNQWRQTTQNRVRMQQHAVEGQIGRLGTYGVVGPDPDKMQVGSVVIEPTSLGLALDETGQLEASALCEGGLPLDRVMTWSTSDEGVATVDQTGLVTGAGEGGAVITAETEGVSATADVSVGGTVAGVIVTPESFSILEGATQQLGAEARDENDNVLVRAFAWSSSDESIATVDEDGMVRALLPGSVTITATAEEVSGSAAAEIGVRIESIVISPATLDLVEGDQIQLTAVAYDARGDEVVTDFAWASSDESVATVDEDGLVQTLLPGPVTITATAQEASGSTQADVATRIVSISVSPSTLDLVLGDVVQLTAVAYDARGDEVVTDFTWASSNESVATVDADGVVTALAEGTVTITAAAGGQQGSAGGGISRGSGKGDIYADLVYLYRNVDGLPLLREVGAERCLQPVSYEPVPGLEPVESPVNGEDVWLLPLEGDATATGLAAAPGEEDDDELGPCDVQLAYQDYVHEVAFGRLNMGRSPDRVLDRALGEVYAKLDTAQVVAVDHAGRLAPDDVPIDAPGENLAVQRELELTGTLGGYVLPRPQVYAHDFLDHAASGLAAGADKFGQIGADLVVYFDRIMGYPDEVTAGGMPTLTGDGTDGVDGVSYLSYRDFTYQRSATFPGCAVGFELVGEDMVRFEGTVMDLVFGGVEAIAENVDGFAQRADDARAVILFEHDMTILEIDRIGENAVCVGNEMP